MSRHGRAVPAILITTFLVGIAACSSSPTDFAKSRLTASDLSSSVAATGTGGNRPFHVDVAGHAGNLTWTYHGNGAVNIGSGTGSESQVNSAGKPYSLTSTPAANLVPVLSMVFTRPAIYWQGWGVMQQALESAAKAAAAGNKHATGPAPSWVSVSASDTASTGSGGQKTLVLAASLADPYLYLDILGTGTGSAAFLRAAAVGGNAARVYRVSIDGTRASSAVPGMYSGLVQLLESAAGGSTLTFNIWIGPSGGIERIGFATSGGAQNQRSKVNVTVSFAGTGVPVTARVASPPGSQESLPLASLVHSASSQAGLTAGGAPGGAESCAEDRADGGIDAGRCTTTTSGG